MNIKLRKKALAKLIKSSSFDKLAEDITSEVSQSSNVNGDAVAEDIFKKIWNSFSEEDLDRLVKEEV